jgi:hypothetical protein
MSEFPTKAQLLQWVGQLEWDAALCATTFHACFVGAEVSSVQSMFGIPLNVCDKRCHPSESDWRAKEISL